MDPLFVQSSLDFLGKACEEQLHLRIKIAVDCVEKGYATHDQVAHFLDLSLELWKQFYENFQEGDVKRVPESLRRLIPIGDLKFFTGFTDEQLSMLERAVDRLMPHNLENMLCSAFVVLEGQQQYSVTR
ncbi:MAG: hypothetical protein GX971_04560 [Firmicutes bacterium]|nr:hypothetical protein [Bacillota bacterium]